MSITQSVCVCVCSLTYPACNVHVPYCYLWPAPLYDICPLCIIHGKKNSKKKLVSEHKICVLIFSTIFV